jgi:colanic acid biosynthesis glycosyl transferase WcaI
MKIALVCEYFYPDDSGSTPTNMSELAHYLKLNYGDLEIDVLTSCHLYRSAKGTDRLPQHEVWDGINIKRFNTPNSKQKSIVIRLLAGGCFALRVLAFLWSKKESYNILIIVTNPPANGLLAWVYFKLRGVPFLYIVHDLYPDTAVALRKLGQASLTVQFFGLFQKSWLHAASRVVVVGRCMRDYIGSKYGLGESRISVIRNWADASAISPGERENDFRRKHGLIGFVVLYGGNFSDYINFDQILEAASLLSKNTSITFVLIGDGARKGEIQNRVMTGNMANVKVLAPFSCAEMGQVLAASDLCLVPLDPRMKGLGSPGKLYSILAAGRPTLAVVAEGGEVARILAEENCGLNIADGDAVAMADEIGRLAQDEASVAEMGANARRCFENRFTLAHAAAQYYSLILTEGRK